MVQSSFLKKLRSFSLGASAADMAMLLLVFFMATTSTEPPKGVTAELPQAVTQGAEQDSIYISISKEGNLYFDGKESSIEDIKDQLAIRQNEKDRIVSITADKDLPYSVVADVINILRQYDFLNVVFISQPREEQ
ncbi:MAG: biopolymer transporter ExbD [Spirochaetota bacterium]